MGRGAVQRRFCALNPGNLLHADTGRCRSMSSTRSLATCQTRSFRKFCIEAICEAFLHVPHRSVSRVILSPRPPVPPAHRQAHLNSQSPSTVAVHHRTSESPSTVAVPSRSPQSQSTVAVQRPRPLSPPASIRSYTRFPESTIALYFSRSSADLQRPRSTLAQIASSVCARNCTSSTFT